jgi:hypothetical protein
MLSWGLNTEITSSGGRITIHSLVTLVLTWFIPPPFCITPTTFKLPFDILSTNTLEGVLTTYHLTSVLVLASPIESSAFAMHGITGSYHSFTKHAPMVCSIRSKQEVGNFSTELQICLANYDSVNVNDIAVTVEELLQAWRDVVGAKPRADIAKVAPIQSGY